MENREKKGLKRRRNIKDRERRITGGQEKEEKKGEGGNGEEKREKGGCKIEKTKEGKIFLSVDIALLSFSLSSYCNYFSISYSSSPSY